MSVIDKSGGEMSKVLTVTTAQCLDSTSVFKRHGDEKIQVFMPLDMYVSA